jgi:hypothetical protein
MKSLPVAIVYRMVHNKEPLQSRKLKYKEKSYRFAVYEITKADFAKIKRVDGLATLTLDVVKQGTQMVEINATSISMEELKKTIAEFPLVGVMSKAKGTLDDTGATRYVGMTSIAFDSLDDFDTAKLKALKSIVSTKEVRDTQRLKLYKWEDTFFRRVLRTDKDWKKTSPARLKEIAKKILTHFKISMDKIHIDTKATKSQQRLGVTRTYRDDVTAETPNFNIVHVHDATIDTLIHELAHVIVWHKYSKGQASGHGAEFCGVYAHILGLFGSFDEDTVTASMKAAGLKIKPFTQTTTKIEEI